MGNSSIKDILEEVVDQKWEFTKLLILQREGMGKVIAFHAEDGIRSPREVGWFELMFSDAKTGMLLDRRLFLMPNTASDHEVARTFGFTPEDSSMHVIKNIDGVNVFLSGLVVNTEEDPHRTYFEMLNKVGSRYKGAVEHLHEVLERVGSLDDSALSLYSDEYRNAVREFNESHVAFKSLATRVAQFEFAK